MSRLLSILETTRGSNYPAFKHQVFEITSADLLQKDFVLDFHAIPESELVMYNLSVLVPSEPGIPRDYSVNNLKVISLVPEFVLLPGDRIHIYYQIA